MTINAVAPGLIETDMTDDVAGDLRGAIPARACRHARGGRRRASRFLASDAAGYITGNTCTSTAALSA